MKYVFRLTHSDEKHIHNIIQRGKFYRGWYFWKPFMWNSRSNQLYIEHNK